MYMITLNCICVHVHDYIHYKRARMQLPICTMYMYDVYNNNLAMHAYMHCFRIL